MIPSKLFDKCNPTLSAEWDAIRSKLNVYVLYYKPTEEAVTQDDHENSNKSPDGWEAYQSGFTVETIRDELEKWPAEDQEAFVEFVLGTRCQGYLQTLLQDVEKIKSALLSDGPHVARAQAWWWKAGVHPLQRGNEDDTLSASHD